MKLSLAAIPLLIAAVAATPLPQTIDPGEAAVLSSVESEFPEIATLVSEFEAGSTAAVKVGVSSLKANPSFQSVLAANPTLSSVNAEVTSLLGRRRA